MKILDTGAAGFIGAFLFKRILETMNDDIVGLNKLNDYYDVFLKESISDSLKPFKRFSFFKGGILDKTIIGKLFDKDKFVIVINLSAQVGTRYSIDPSEYFLDLVQILSEEFARAGTLSKEFVPARKGDTHVTYEDQSDLDKEFNFSPPLSLRVGLWKLTECYKDYGRSAK